MKDCQVSPGLCVGGGEFVSCFHKAQSLHCIRGVDAADPCVLVRPAPLLSACRLSTRKSRCAGLQGTQNSLCDSLSTIVDPLVK